MIKKLILLKVTILPILFVKKKNKVFNSKYEYRREISLFKES